VVFSDGSNVSTNSTLCEVVSKGQSAVYWNNSQQMLNQSLLNVQNLTIAVMAPVNCTVGHTKNAFNANCIKKIKLNSSVSLQHCAQYRLQYSVCVTSVLHRH
jgi:hypothetical protein